MMDDGENKNPLPLWERVGRGGKKNTRRKKKYFISLLGRGRRSSWPMAVRQKSFIKMN